MRGGMLTPIEVENYRGNRRCCSSMLHDTGKGGIHLYNVIKGIPSPSILIGGLASFWHIKDGIIIEMVKGIRILKGDIVKHIRRNRWRVLIFCYDISQILIA